MRRVSVLAAMALAGSAPAMSAAPTRGGSIIAAGGRWAAILRDGRCDAESRIRARTPAGEDSALAGFTFALSRRPWGQFHARLSRPPRAGATVMATIGKTQFLLFARGRNAWARDARQSAAMIAAVRASSGMRISARDSAGRRFTDHFALDFAPTAIDAAAAHCAGLRSGQRR